MANTVTTAVACRIARIERARFNQVVTAGDYPCAPTTTKGATRIFGTNDVIALTYFRRLLDDNLTASAAGQLVENIHRQIEKNPKAETVTIYRDLVPGIPFRRAETNVFSYVFNIQQMREFVLREIESERELLGERD